MRSRVTFFWHATEQYTLHLHRVHNLNSLVFFSRFSHSGKQQYRRSSSPVAHQSRKRSANGAKPKKGQTDGRTDRYRQCILRKRVPVRVFYQLNLIWPVPVDIDQHKHTRISTIERNE